VIYSRDEIRIRLEITEKKHMALEEIRKEQEK
jgi:hypothetical protein